MAFLLRADLSALEPVVQVTGTRSLHDATADLTGSTAPPGAFRVRLTVDADGMHVRAWTERGRVDKSSMQWVFVGRLSDGDGARLTGRFELPTPVRSFAILYRTMAWIFTAFVVLGSVVSLIRGELLRAGLLVLGAAAPHLLLLALYALLAVSLSTSARRHADLVGYLADTLSARGRTGTTGSA